VERWGGGDDFQPGFGVRAAFLEDPSGFPEGAEQYVERLQAVGRLGYRPGQFGAQVGLAVEEDLALVREVPEERALVDAGPGGDLRRGGLVEAALPVQVEGRLREAAASCTWPTAATSPTPTP
jgi:hypothetical protein